MYRPISKPIKNQNEIVRYKYSYWKENTGNQKYQAKLWEKE